jgi:hypothetical protein
VLSYGCLGFGYVITATFIVAMLREGPGGRGAETVVWLIVGLTAAPSVVVWSRISARIGAIRAYQAVMLIEAVGVGLSALSTGTAALGSTFMGLTAIGLQEAARRSGGDGRAMMALMTASFGLGQDDRPWAGGLAARPHRQLCRTKPDRGFGAGRWRAARLADAGAE